MSVERVEELHQKASEHYLSGEYPQAIEAWQEVLRLDPAHEEALEGMRMSKVLAEGDNFSLAKPMDPIPAAKIGDLDPSRQGEGMDAGDLSRLEAIPLASPPPAPAASLETSIDAMFKPAAKQAPAAEEEDLLGSDAVGLAPADPPKPAPRPAAPAAPADRPASAAATELGRRIADLMTEARAKADAGDREEALAILSRVFILDEDNAEAKALEQALREAEGQSNDQIETWISEAVQGIETGDLDGAESRLRSVLEKSPEHREAIHYLEEIKERRAPSTEAAHHEDLLASMRPDATAGPGPSTFEADAAAPVVPLVVRPAPKPERLAPKLRHEPGESVPGLAVPKKSSAKTLALAGVGLAVIAAAAFGAKLVFFSGGKPAPARIPAPPAAPAANAAPSARAARPKAAGPTSAAPQAQGAPAAPRPAASVDDALGRARSAMGSADFGAAVIAYNEALRFDSGNAEAREGLQKAGEAFKAKKAVDDQLDRVRGAFKDGEYSSALRILYRLPSSMDPKVVDRYKAAGWFDMAVVSLRAGDCAEAMKSLDEVLALTPDDRDARILRDYAAKYGAGPKDRSFFDKVEAIGFRNLD